LGRVSASSHGPAPPHSRGAQAAGVAVDDRGFIPVDEQLRTSVPHILAIGDVIGDRAH